MIAELAADAARVAALALAEDGARDVTTEVTVAPRAARAEVEFRAAGTLAGGDYATAVARACGLELEWFRRDGERLEAGAVAGVVRGDLGAILRAERPMLNLLQRASGIATMTREFADAVAGTSCRILHTRKTAPGLRLLDVSAVLAGGGALHRLDLAHTVMVKDNHWAALALEGRTLARALAEARARGVTDLQVEVESLAQVRKACRAGATRLLVDNQTPATVRRWAAAARDLSASIAVEATGGITLKNVRRYAEAGADFVSVGALTHSARAADVALELR